jgi:hypothetical protein
MNSYILITTCILMLLGETRCFASGDEDSPEEIEHKKRDDAALYFIDAATSSIM